MTPLDISTMTLVHSAPALSPVEAVMANLEEFPDGGRATLVRRYSPPLTQRQLDILRACPYENPTRIGNRRLALALVQAKLLEENPTARDVFRCTDAGLEVLRMWLTAGFTQWPKSK